LSLRVGSALCALLLACLAWSSTSHAENGVPPEYTEAVKQALQELDMNDLPEALAEFRRAHEIFPNARSLRGMGMIEFDLRDYRSAMLHLQEALASSSKPLTGKMRTETERCSTAHGATWASSASPRIPRTRPS
jgi:tetratricopeptide (TPR) repeat protein